MECSSTNVSEHAAYLPVMMESRSRCQCGKANYPGEGSADKAVKSLRAYGKDRRGWGRLRPYRCPERPHIWHVGHSDE